MIGRTTAVCAASLIACAGGSAQAQAVFSNALADRNNGSGREMTAWIQADDFRLTRDTVLTGASVEWFTLGGLQSWDRTIQWSIYTSGGGKPGVLIASGGAVDVTTTHDGMYNFDRYTTSFRFDAPAAMYAGSTYWFGLHFASDFGRDDLYWADASDAQLSTTREAPGGNTGSWQSVSGLDRAFSLIPAPGSSALALCTGLVLWRRRRG